MKTLLEYQGYIAEMEWDEESGLYCGSALNMGEEHGVILEIPAGRDLRAEFGKAIDCYLEDCAKDGVPVAPPQPLTEPA